MTHVPAKRSVNTFGLFDRSLFTYRADSATLLCPEGKTLTRLPAQKFHAVSFRDCHRLFDEISYLDPALSAHARRSLSTYLCCAAMLRSGE